MTALADTGLGTGGIAGSSKDGVPGVQLVNVRRGWQSLRRAAENEAAVTDLTDPPADAIYLPDDGTYVDLQVRSATAGEVTFQLMMWPIDPGTDATGADLTKNLSDGAGAGWSETVTLTTATHKAPQIGGTSPAAEAFLCAPTQKALRGAYRMAARITTASGDTEIVYRVF